MKPALIIGSTCVDVIINIDHLPKTEENIRPSSQSMSIGGCAYNVAYMMRLLDAPHTFISPVGGGTYGDYVAKHFTEKKIPIAVQLPKAENGCCYCLVEATGERTFMSYHGVEYSFQKKWMEPYNAASYGLTYICGLEIEEPTGMNLIEYLEEHPSLEICYAPGPRIAHIGVEKNRRILAMHPILHINEQEAMQMSGEVSYEKAAEYLYGVTGNSVIVTLGEQGTYCTEKGGARYLLPSTPAEHVADTIGAGDSHVGTVLACLTKDIPLRDAIAYANQVAGAVVSVKGASLPPELLPRFERLACEIQ